MRRARRQYGLGAALLATVGCGLIAPNPAAADPSRQDGGRMLAPPLPAEFESIFNEALAEFDEAQGILLTNPDRARRLFRSAADRLEGLMAAGVVNGRLEYNLGNCYLQAGDVGRAILHYRRAQRLMPTDPLLADNLKTARNRRLTQIRPSRASAFLHSVFFWHYQTSTGSRIRFALVVYLGIWLLLVLRNFLRRRWVSGAALVCVLLTLSVGMSAGLTYWSERNAPQGVVLDMDVAVYKGPGSGYQRQFEQPLQPGTEFVLRQQRQGWWETELPDGKSGWIAAAQAELIPPAGP